MMNKLLTAIIIVGCLSFSSAGVGPEQEADVLQVQSALRNLSQGQTLSSLSLTDSALASLHSVTNLNLYPQRLKPLVWPYWSLDCTACEAAAALIIGLFQTGAPLEEIEEAVILLCTTLAIEAAEVCEGSVRSFGWQVEYVLQQREDITPALFCGVFIGGDCGDQGEINDWTVELPGDKPVEGEVESPVEDGELYRVLHLADIHVDLTYTPGTVLDCALPCCCLAGTSMAGEGEAGAGYWGEYQCDVPMQTVQAMMDDIARTNPDLDYIIYTGDSPAHDVWKQSKDRNLENELTVLDLIDSHFPGVPVYLALGNHESMPVNMFPTAGEEDSPVSGSWLYNGVADLAWAQHISSGDLETFRRNGFYSTLIQPGLRLISLNTNFCAGENFFLLLGFNDPAGQLAWLAEQLWQSEQAGEKVHVLGHHPLHSCLPGWKREYGRIMNRFQATVRAQFHGHTHDDWFIVYHNETGQPSTTAFVAPSGTSFTNRNPEYRVYNVAADQQHSSFGHIADHHTWSMDLSTVAAETDQPAWSKLYSAKTDLKLAGVTAQHWKQVLDTASAEDEMFLKLVTYFNQNHVSSTPEKRNFLCHMTWNTECPY